MSSVDVGIMGLKIYIAKSKFLAESSKNGGVIYAKYLGVSAIIIFFDKNCDSTFYNLLILPRITLAIFEGLHFVGFSLT